MKKQFNLTFPSGTQVWYLDTRDRSDEVLSGRIYVGDLHWHRVDGPAVIGTNGRQEWWTNGKLHREDGPAVVWANGTQGWYINDKICRDNKSFQQAADITDEEMMILIIKYGDVK